MGLIKKHYLKGEIKAALKKQGFVEIGSKLKGWHKEYSDCVCNVYVSRLYYVIQDAHKVTHYQFANVADFVTGLVRGGHITSDIFFE